jgi:hypothetical protein
MEYTFFSQFVKFSFSKLLILNEAKNRVDIRIVINKIEIIYMVFIFYSYLAYAYIVGIFNVNIMYCDILFKKKDEY